MKPVSSSTLVVIPINTWFQRRRETGDFKAKVRENRGNGQKITDWEKFRAFVETHGDKTQAEMAELWDGEISDRHAPLNEAIAQYRVL